MSKLDTMLRYQETESKKQEGKQATLATPSRQKFNRLHKLLKEQQANIQKLSDEIETRSAQVARLNDQAAKLMERIEIEESELETIRGDEESTAEEMTELRVDIERLQKEINQVVREAKRLLGEIEKATEDFKKTNQTARAAKKEYDQLRVVCEQERNESAAELQKFDDELAKLKADCDPALFAKYEKVRQHHPIPIVPVVGGKCSGCNMSLPMVMLKKLHAPDAVIECENCGRILYGEDR